MNAELAFVLVIAVIDLIWLLCLLGLPFLTNAMLLGVYVPPAERGLPQVRRIRRTFLSLGLCGALLGLLLAFAAHRLSGGSEGWTLAALLVPQALAAAGAWTFSRRRALELKSQRGWQAPDSSRRTAYIGTGAERPSTGIPTWAYLLHAVILIGCAVLAAVYWESIPQQIPTHFNAAGIPDQYAAKSLVSVFALNLLQALMTALFVGLHLSIGRTRQNLDPSDPAGSLRKQNRFRGANAYVLYFLSLVVVLLLGWIQARSTYDFRGTLSAGYALIFALLLIALPAAFFFHVHRRGLLEVGANRHHGEDRYWRGGAFYYNPQDPAFMVEKRVGLGWTFNFARPLSWLVMSASVLLPLAAVAAAMWASR